MESISHKIELKQVEEFTKATYLALYRKGFNYLHEVNDFIEDVGDKWYKEVRNLGPKRREEVEKVIDLYRF